MVVKSSQMKPSRSRYGVCQFSTNKIKINKEFTVDCLGLLFWKRPFRPLRRGAKRAFSEKRWLSSYPSTFDILGHNLIPHFQIFREDFRFQIHLEIDEFGSIFDKSTPNSSIARWVGPNSTTWCSNSPFCGLQIHLEIDELGSLFGKHIINHIFCCVLSCRPNW